MKSLYEVETVAPPPESRTHTASTRRSGDATRNISSSSEPQPARASPSSPTKAPAFLVVPRELEIVALPRHADSDVPDAGPGVEPGAQRPERAIVRRHGAAGEADCCPQEPAAWVEHVYSITWSARSSNVCGIVSPSAFAVLRLISSSNFVGCSIGRSPGLAPLRIRSTYDAARRW